MVTGAGKLIMTHKCSQNITKVFAGLQRTGSLWGPGKYSGKQGVSFSSCIHSDAAKSKFRNYSCHFFPNSLANLASYFVETRLQKFGPLWGHLGVSLYSLFFTIGQRKFPVLSQCVPAAPSCPPFPVSAIIKSHVLNKPTTPTELYLKAHLCLTNQ